MSNKKKVLTESEAKKIIEENNCSILGVLNGTT